MRKQQQFASDLDSSLVSQSFLVWHKSEPVHYGMPFALTLVFVLVACCLGIVAFGR